MTNQGGKIPWLSPNPLAVRRAGDLIFAGGEGLFADVDFDTALGGNPLFPHHGSSTERQLGHAYQTLDRALTATGSGLDQVMTINAFHVDPAGIDPALKLRGTVFPGDGPPASTLLLVDGLASPTNIVATDVIALANDAQRSREFLLRNALGAPLPVLGELYARPVFSQLVRGGGFIFTQGKGITSGPALGHRHHPHHVWPAEAQTELTIDYLETLLGEYGATLGDVVRAEISLSYPEAMVAVDRVWRRRFPTSPPARVVLPARLALTAEVVVEISFIAVDPDGPLDRETVTPPGIATYGWESPAVRAGDYVFLSSRYAIPADTGVLVGSAAFAGHARMVEEACVVLHAAGAVPSDIVRRRNFVLDREILSMAEAAWRDVVARPSLTAITILSNDFVVPHAIQSVDIIAHRGR